MGAGAGARARVGDIDVLDLILELMELAVDVLVKFVELDRMRVDDRGPFRFYKRFKISLSPKELMIIYYWYYFS